MRAMRKQIEQSLQSDAEQLGERVQQDVTDLLSEFTGSSVTKDVGKAQATITVTAPEFDQDLHAALIGYVDRRMSSKVAVMKLFADAGIR